MMKGHELFAGVHATRRHYPLISTVDHSFYMANSNFAMLPNPALNRTGRYGASTWPASARPAG